MTGDKKENQPAIRMAIRPRRNRRSQAIRSLVAETNLSANDLILPLFVVAGKKQKTKIESMPGVFRYSTDLLLEKCLEARDLGISAVALFPVIENSLKNTRATEASNSDGLLPEAVAKIKAKIPELMVITDVAMDPYSSDGHDGLLVDGEIHNDASLPILAEMAVMQARAGADFVAPSDMMDGRVGYMRRALDQAGFSQVGILAYSAKYCSAFYGPFREALDSAPRSGDKKTYQMDPANRREAIREALLDVQEGADIVMVKPAMAYLDIIAAIRSKVNVPVAAYQVSGEFAMIQAAAEKGWLDRERAIFESLIAIKRAGADLILSYFAIDAARGLSR